MKKVLIIGGALAVAYFAFAGSKPKPTNTTTPVAPASFVSQFENKHIIMDDNKFSIIVHNGKIYYDDKPGFFQQYVDQFGVKEYTTYPSWSDFYTKIMQNGAVAELSLSDLFSA